MKTPLLKTKPKYSYTKLIVPILIVGALIGGLFMYTFDSEEGVAEPAEVEVIQPSGEFSVSREVSPEASVGGSCICEKMDADKVKANNKVCQTDSLISDLVCRLTCGGSCKDGTMKKTVFKLKKKGRVKAPCIKEKAESELSTCVLMQMAPVKPDTVEDVPEKDLAPRPAPLVVPKIADDEKFVCMDSVKNKECKKSCTASGFDVTRLKEGDPCNTSKILGNDAKCKDCKWKKVKESLPEVVNPIVNDCGAIPDKCRVEAKSNPQYAPPCMCFAVYTDTCKADDVSNKFTGMGYDAETLAPTDTCSIKEGKGALNKGTTVLAFQQHAALSTGVTTFVNPKAESIKAKTSEFDADTGLYNNKALTAFLAIPKGQLRDIEVMKTASGGAAQTAMKGLLMAMIQASHIRLKALYKTYTGNWWTCFHSGIVIPWIHLHSGLESFENPVDEDLPYKKDGSKNILPPEEHVHCAWGTDLQQAQNWELMAEMIWPESAFGQGKKQWADDPDVKKVGVDPPGDAVKAYTKNDYTDINGYLRTKKTSAGPIKDKIDLINAYLDGIQPKTTSYVTARAGNWPTDLWKTFAAAPRGAGAFFGAIEHRDCLIDLAYSSSSGNVDVFFTDGTYGKGQFCSSLTQCAIFIVSGTSARNIADLSDYEAEAEVLWKPGSLYRVSGKFEFANEWDGDIAKILREKPEWNTPFLVKTLEYIKKNQRTKYLVTLNEVPRAFAKGLCKSVKNSFTGLPHVLR